MGGRRALRIKRVQVKCVGDAGGAHTQRMHLLRFHALPVVRRTRVRVPQHLVRADNALDVRRRIVPCAGLVRMVLRSVTCTHHASEAQVRCADLGVARTRSDAEDSVRVVGRAHRRRRSGGHVEALVLPSDACRIRADRREDALLDGVPQTRGDAHDGVVQLVRAENVYVVT